MHLKLTRFMVSWWYQHFQGIFQQYFVFYKLQFQEPYKTVATPKYLIPATLRQIYNPYFTLLKSIIKKTFAM